MSDQNQALRDDIAFMRSLAEAGRETPMLGGRILFGCGLIFGSASLILWWLTTREGMTGAVYWIVWGVALAAYLAVLIPSLRSMPRAVSTRQAAVGVAFSGVGFAVSTVIVGLLLMTYRLGEGTVGFALPCVLTALYGGAWWIAGALQQKRWVQGVGVASFAAALANAWWGAQADRVWLVYGLTLLGIFAVPGLILILQARGADRARG